MYLCACHFTDVFFFFHVDETLHYNYPKYNLILTILLFCLNLVVSCSTHTQILMNLPKLILKLMHGICSSPNSSSWCSGKRKTYGTKNTIVNIRFEIVQRVLSIENVSNRIQDHFDQNTIPFMQEHSNNYVNLCKMQLTCEFSTKTNVSRISLIANHFDSLSTYTFWDPIFGDWSIMIQFDWNDIYGKTIK